MSHGIDTQLWKYVKPRGLMNKHFIDLKGPIDVPDKCTKWLDQGVFIYLFCMHIEIYLIILAVQFEPGVILKLCYIADT